MRPDLKSDSITTPKFVVLKRREEKPLAFLSTVFATLNREPRENNLNKGKHNKKEETRKVNSCNICNRSFLSAKKYAKHVKNVKCHGSTMCQECGKLVKLPILKKHMESHEKREGNLSCQLCAKTLPTKKFLERHMKIHALKETCPTCGKIVNTASFEEHVKSHLEKEKPNKCPQCMFSCYKQTVLEKHMILHSISNDTLYTCETCHYLTTDVTNMKKHRRTHLNIKTKSCTFCNYTSDTEGKIRLHIKRKHGTNMS